MKKIHSIVKKLFLTILIFNVLLIFFFLAKNNKTFLTYSIYFFFILSPCVRIVVASINLVNKQGAVSKQQCVTKGIQTNLKKLY